MKPKLMPMLLLSAAAACQAAESVTDGKNLVIFPADIHFVGKEGATQYATLFGDPKMAGFYVIRVKLPAGYKNAPHWHPDDPRTVTVISGTIYFALGDKFDESKLRPYPVGTFYTEPARVPHYNWTKDGEVILQVAGYGPSASNPVVQK
jgi:uncharacterized RmlC-like cupin family protein